LITYVTILYWMKKLLLILFYIGYFFCLSTKLFAQSNQTLTNGSSTTAVDFSGGCTYNWVNSDPSIGLAASGTGDIASFKAVNTGKSPVTATITATPVNTNGFAYIANSGSNNVSVINTTTNTVTATIKVGENPYGVAASPNGNYVYVTNRTSGSVSVINTLLNTVEATINVGSNPLGLCVSPDGKILYVSNDGSSSISVINTSTYKVTNTFSTNKNPFDVTISPDGSRLYIADEGSNIVSVINTTNDLQVASISVGFTPWGIIISPDGKYIYVANSLADEVTVINTSSNTINTVIRFSINSTPTGLAISSDGTTLYVSDQSENCIYIINTTTGIVTNTVNVDKAPLGLSLSGDGIELYASNEGSNSVSVINTASGKLIKTVNVGAEPYSLGNFTKGNNECNPITFTIKVNPTTSAITANAVSGTISACVGTASASPDIQQFTVSGSSLTAPVIATAPAGFELSLATGNGYGKSVTLNQSAGNLSNITIYVRSAAADAAGPISGNVVLSSTGATDQNVAVSGVVNALPTVNKVNDQTLTSGTATTAVNFTGTGNTFKWTNDTPGIGLAANGIGNISAFTAINTGSTPVIATITATPISEGFAYIANSGDGTISVINVATNTIISTIKPPHNPTCICISPNGSKAYIGCSGGSSTVTVINTITNAIISTIPVSSSGESTGITVSPDGNMLYVVNYVTGTVSVVNTATSAVVAVIPVGQNPYGIAISPDGNNVYVAYTFNNYISVINTANNKITASINVGIAPQDVAVSPDGSKVYVPVSNLNHVAVIDPKTNNITALIPTDSGPGIIALSPDGTKAYVGIGLNNVSVINTATNAVISTIKIGSAPNGICVSPDGNFIYVTNTLTNNVSVINASNNKVIATVKVGIAPISLGSFVTAGTGCTGMPMNFTITVKPTSATPVISANIALGNISACEGTASKSPNVEQFTVSGRNLSADITATAPAGFEISLSSTDGYANSLVITPIAGTVSNTIIYVRSSATVVAGNISGNIILSSIGATDQPVAVSGTVNAIPSVNTPGYQVLVNGARTSLVNFTGTASIFSWTNDTPSIGLAASGTGDISSFTAVNNTSNPVTATITVTPLNSAGCNGIPIEYTITVNPSPASLTANGTLIPMTTIYGSPSSIERFTVSGTSVTSGILITPPAGFEVSLNERDFSPTVTVNGTGNIPETGVFIRLASSTHVGSYSGNIAISTNNATNATLMVPVSTVTRASLTITADNKTRFFGVPNPPLTITYDGFVNNDSADQLTSPPTLTTDATILSPVGQYAINVNPDAASPDYMFKYDPGILTITPVLSALSIPNTFTPNGDGINDTWVIQAIEGYPKSTVNIFNRWGQKVFTSIGYHIPWDGTYQGKALSSGTYYYLIDPKNGQAVISGWVAIIR